MAQGTTEPTEKYRDATATPSSPVLGSMATIEKVETGGSDCGQAEPAAMSRSNMHREVFFMSVSVDLRKHHATFADKLPIGQDGFSNGSPDFLSGLSRLRVCAGP